MRKVSRSLVLMVGLLSTPLCALPSRPLYTYTLTQDGAPGSYDEAVAAASLQGIINRQAPELYLLSPKNPRPQFWLDLLAKDGRWLQGRERKPLPDLGALVKLGGKRVKGAIIWDPDVPASLNVATTLAGVQDAVVLSPEFAGRCLAQWRLPVLQDLRGKFTGAETGSKKNDAYRWAIREYLAKGRCSSGRLCLFEDAFSARARGDIGYAVTRDWAVKSRAFVFDLSPWGDEAPADDPRQRVGLDLETYKLILTETLRQSAGRHTTELTGFFAQDKYSDGPTHKSAHQGVPTEWETVWLITPFNCYQNTLSSDCFNQSLHSQAPRRTLKQRSASKPVALENKAYLCILMADYDSATPLYDFLPKYWHNADRGKVPLAWGIDPSLLETYPDIIAYFYETASAADTFTADASAAGYTNPNRVQKEYLPLFVQHNRQFFREADMTLAPMVLDQNEPSAAVKDAFQQFAPEGFATIVMDYHGQGSRPPQPQVWKGMPILDLLNDTCNSQDSGQIADLMANAIKARGNVLPGFYFFRTVWVSPTTIKDALEALRGKYPELKCEVLAPQSFFGLFKEALERQGKVTHP
jgi:GxGYxYP putative glycoside hydrolase C-terminal domain/GxGYxYP_N second domain/GxGYxYP_N 1st domain